MINKFYAYMHARQSILNRRKAGEKKPWTTDEVLLNYRFCNVFREDDTVTIWIDKHIRQPYADHPYLWFMLCIARQINHPETLAELIASADYGTWPDEDGHWDWNRAAAIMDDRRERGEKVYTGAYMIRAESDPTKHWYSWTKQEYLCGIVLHRVLDQQCEFNLMMKGEHVAELKNVQHFMEQFHGWGPFMSYEVVTDMRHTRYLRDAPDIYTWANAGPGALRGLNRIHKRDLKRIISKTQAVDEMQGLLRQLNAFRSNNPAFQRVFEGCPEFEMRDVEHTLCEFDKYQRVLLGQGTPRSKYNGRI